MAIRVGRHGAVTAVVVVLASLLAGSLALTQAATLLYDGTLGTLPSSQGWTFAGAGSATQTLGGGAVILDTTAFNASQFGYGRNDQLLDSTVGVQLSFAVQLLSESHATSDRAGFSVLMLDAAHRGVELGFWSDRIFAQNVGFTHGEELLRDTSVMLQYQLLLAGPTYQLTVSDGLVTSVLNGALRDYSVAPGAPAPYFVNNALFFGDDTSSARARFALASVSVSEVPEPSAAALLLGGLGVLIGWRCSSRKRPARGVTGKPS